MNAPRPFRADVPPIKRMEVDAVLTLFSVPALAIVAAIAPSNGDLEASNTISKVTFDQSYAVASTTGAISGTGAAAATGVSSSAKSISTVSLVSASGSGLGSTSFFSSPSALGRMGRRCCVSCLIAEVGSS